MESHCDASREELIETIEFLKEENEKTVDELMEKLRSIEGEQLKTNISNRQMEGKIRELKGEINSFKKTPLILATVTEVFDDKQVGIQGAVGHEFLVTYPGSIKKESLVPGARVALNQKNLGVVNVFPPKKDKNVCFNYLAYCVYGLNAKRANDIVTTLDLHTLEDLLYLKHEHLQKVPGIGEKLANKIIDSISDDSYDQY